MIFKLPYPISTNALYKNVRGKGRVKTDKYKYWIEAAGWKLKEARLINIKGKVEIEISIKRPDKRKRDIDNLAKGILDLVVKHQIIEDDQHIEKLTIAWRYDGPEGAIVEIKDLK